MVKTGGRLFFILFMKLLQKKRGGGVLNNFTKIGEALKYIDGHLDEKINLESLSEKFYFSPYYFHRLFTAVVGKSLAAYIRDRRILFACRQLGTTDNTILEIALNCGWAGYEVYQQAERRNSS